MEEATGDPELKVIGNRDVSPSSGPASHSGQGRHLRDLAGSRRREWRQREGGKEGLGSSGAPLRPC